MIILIMVFIMFSFVVIFEMICNFVCFYKARKNIINEFNKRYDEFMGIVCIEKLTGDFTNRAISFDMRINFLNINFLNTQYEHEILDIIPHLIVNKGLDYNVNRSKDWLNFNIWFYEKVNWELIK